MCFLKNQTETPIKKMWKEERKGIKQRIGENHAKIKADIGLLALVLHPP